MKFTTSIFAAALATVSFAAAAVQEPFPDTYTLSFTNLETGTFLGKLALDKVYNAFIDPIGPTTPAVIIRKGDSGGGIRMREPWTYLFPPEPMTRDTSTGWLVFFSDIPNDPASFLKVNGDLGYMDHDSVVTTWYACLSTRLPGLYQLYWRDPKGCIPVSAQVVPL